MKRRDNIQKGFKKELDLNIKVVHPKKLYTRKVKYKGSIYE